MASNTARVKKKLLSPFEVNTVKPEIFPFFFRVPFKYHIHHKSNSSESKSFFPCSLIPLFPSYIYLKYSSSGRWSLRPLPFLGIYLFGVPFEAVKGAWFSTRQSEKVHPVPSKRASERRK